MENGVLLMVSHNINLKGSQTSWCRRAATFISSPFHFHLLNRLVDQTNSKTDIIFCDGLIFAFCFCSRTGKACLVQTYDASNPTEGLPHAAHCPLIIPYQNVLDRASFLQTNDEHALNQSINQSFVFLPRKPFVQNRFFFLCLLVRA